MEEEGIWSWVLFFYFGCLGFFPLSLDEERRKKKRESGRKKEETVPAGGDSSVHLGSLFAEEGGPCLDPGAWSLASSTSLSGRF